MRSGLGPALLVALVFTPGIARDKNKARLPACVLSAQTVLVIVDSDAGEPVDQPCASRIARANVEKALAEWGRFRPLNDGEKSDLIITVRTGKGKTMQSTTNQRRRGSISGRASPPIPRHDHIGAHGGQPPTDPATYPPGTPPRGAYPSGTPPQGGPRVSNAVGPSEDIIPQGHCG
jgi:hypothetical protein